MGENCVFCLPASTLLRAAGKSNLSKWDWHQINFSQNNAWLVEVVTIHLLLLYKCSWLLTWIVKIKWKQLKECAQITFIGTNCVVCLQAQFLKAAGKSNLLKWDWNQIYFSQNNGWPVEVVTNVCVCVCV